MAISDRTHPNYDDNLDLWNLYRSSAKGGDDFINDDNLFSHRLEDSEDFEERLKRAYHLNFCDTIPKIYNSYIFRNNIERAGDANLKIFRNNADGRGNSISEFMKTAGYFASVYGVIHIFVDIPKSKKNKPSIADIKAESIVPYCTLIHPTQLKDWSVDEYGNFRWVIIESTYFKDLDPALEREEETHYKVITTEEWWIEDEDENKIKFEEEGRESEGKNDLGFIPIVTLYHEDNEDDKVGESLLKDIVRINRIIMNWCSCIDEQIERQTFSQLIMPDDASMDEDEEKGEDPLTRVSTSSIFTFNPDSKHPPGFISPDTENISIIWTMVVDHIKEIYRLSGLQGGTSDLYTSKSGRQAQMSFKGVNAALADKAGTYQKAENLISEIAYALLGLNVEEFIDVKYPATFDIVALGEELDGLMKIMEKNFSETLNKTIQKDISRKSVPMATEDTREQIESEIDAGDGIVESNQVKTAATQQEKDGDGNPEAPNLEKSFKTKEKSDKEESSHRSEKD
jgi:hypothetical protein